MVVAFYMFRYIKAAGLLKYETSKLQQSKHPSKP